METANIESDGSVRYILRNFADDPEEESDEGETLQPGPAQAKRAKLLAA